MEKKLIFIESNVLHRIYVSHAGKRTKYGVKCGALSISQMKGEKESYRDMFETSKNTDDKSD